MCDPMNNEQHIIDFWRSASATMGERCTSELVEIIDRLCAECESLRTAYDALQVEYERLRARLAEAELASRPAGEPVAWVARDPDGKRTRQFRTKPSIPDGHSIWMTELGSAKVWYDDDQYACLFDLKPGQLMALYDATPLAPEPPPEPYDVMRLPGYAWHNDVLTVFEANGRTAQCAELLNGEWRWTIIPEGSRVTGVIREQAERAASAWVQGDVTNARLREWAAACKPPPESADLPD